MNGAHFLMPIGDARAFRQSASPIEQETARLEVRGGDPSPVGGASGWPSHTVRESLKTAGQFNPAVALKHRLKCRLRLNDVTPPGGRDGRRLARLYELFGARQVPAGAGLERPCGQAAAEYPFTLVWSRS